jgi:hypothetical protein
VLGYQSPLRIAAILRDGRHGVTLTRADAIFAAAPVIARVPLQKPPKRQH